MLTAIFDTARGPIRLQLFADQTPLTVASFVNRQDAIDHWHGAHEDT